MANITGAAERNIFFATITERFVRAQGLYPLAHRCDTGRMLAEKDAPLRQDVHMLGMLLGQVLLEQDSAELFEAVEAARSAARHRRETALFVDSIAAAQPLAPAAPLLAAESALQGLLVNLEPSRAVDIVRAFSAYFGLVNLAERLHRIRRRRSYLQAQSPSQPGSLIDVLQRLKERGVGYDEVRRHIETLQIVPVFTAHPTEATRRALLLKEQRMARALADRLPGHLLPSEETASLSRLRHEIASAWQTDELTRPPSVADEVEHVVFYLTEVIYRIVPVFYEGLHTALVRVFGAAADLRPTAPLVRFGTWVGGDMDGNPNVGAASIRATLGRQRELIVRRYSGELRELSEYLTQSVSRVDVAPTIFARIAVLQQLLSDAEASAQTQDMPYRVLVELMALRLQATAQDKVQGYRTPQELLEDLKLIYDSLVQNRGLEAGAFRVQRLLYRVQTFGFHLAALDIRQDSLVHRRAVASLLGIEAFATWPADRRTERLRQELTSAQSIKPVYDNSEDSQNLRRCLEVMQAIGACRARFGPSAIGLYIISMAEGLDDILAVLCLARAGGLVGGQGEIDLDVAPLFETVPDLTRAGAILEALLADASYSKHLRSRGQAQFVMLGYSDSNKESGLVASRWALQEAQRALLCAAAPHGVALTLFHGRGGTASRGGSKPRAAILAEPRGAVQGQLRLTEQGEIIHAKYGLRDIALRTLELMGGAVLEVTACPPDEPEAIFFEVMRFCAETSRQNYRRLVYEDENFFAYFSAATPIDVIGRLRIGSRPAARRAQSGIGDLRAIPWVFAWTQNRQMLPGWYGLGQALQAAEQKFGLAMLQRMYLQWPFFANMLNDAQMVMAKADMRIGALYAALAGIVGDRLWPQIYKEFERTTAMLVAVKGQHKGADDADMLARTIRLRNPYVDPMSIIQVDCLRRWRATDRQDTDLERVLLSCVKGIARGLQNTG